MGLKPNRSTQASQTLPIHRHTEKHIASLVMPTLEMMGYHLVRVHCTHRSESAHIQIMVERLDGAAITVADCARSSRALSSVLDVEEPVAGSYNLEVSSPGIDRPLVRIDDFVRFTGFEARVETSALFEGRRRFQGRILGADKGLVRLESADAQYAIPFESIRHAHLILTDDMLRSSGCATGRAPA